MPFDPSLPAANSPVSSAELRAQFTSLHDRIVALEALLVPAQATLSAEVDGAGVVTLTVAASGAATFAVMFRPQESPESYNPAASGAGPVFTHSPGAGAWEYRALGVNAAGEGPWSEAALVTV